MFFVFTCGQKKLVSPNFSLAWMFSQRVGTILYLSTLGNATPNVLITTLLRLRGSNKKCFPWCDATLSAPFIIFESCSSQWRISKSNCGKKKQRSKQHTSALLHVLYCDWIGRIHAKILHFQRDDNQGFIDIDIQIFPICSNETTYCIGNPHANSNRSRAGRRRKLQKVKSGDAQGI